MAEEIQSACDKVFFWSDEKILSVETVVNIQNDKIYATCSECLAGGVIRLFGRRCGHL